ncbi:MAG: GNAT family N-acetyltransferase [Chloroflexota bacterium]
MTTPIETIQLQVFDAKTASDDAWDSYIALRQAYFAEREPNDPIPPADLIRKEVLVGEESERRESSRWVIYDTATSTAIGTMGAGGVTEAHEDYEKDKHLVYYDIYLKPEFRRRGIGTYALKTIASIMGDRGKTTMEAWVNLDDGAAFQDAIGAKVTLRMRSNRLQLAQLDWDMMQAWVNDGEARNPDTQLVLTSDLPIEEHCQPYANLMMDIFAQMPKEDAGGFPEVITIDRMKEWHDDIEKTGGHHLSAYTVEPDGTITAMSEIYYHPDEPHIIEQELTGVHLSARGRGLGKWTKAAMALHIRETYPEVKFINTVNANVNAAMLHINQTMGYTFHKQNSVYEIKVEDVLS